MNKHFEFILKSAVLALAITLIIMLGTIPETQGENREKGDKGSVAVERVEPILTEYRGVSVPVQKQIPLAADTKKLIDVPYINQLTDYPNGCESVSTVMLLNYLGIDITVDDLIDNYLDMGDAPIPGSISPDPHRVYLGDPRSENGWGCYCTVIANALTKLLWDQEYTVSCHYQKTLEQLCEEYIDNDIPVVVWVTVGMEDASHSSNYHRWRTSEGLDVAYNRRLHSMVLCGYDEENYYFNDPLTEGMKPYPKADSEKAYSILGMQCITVESTAEN